MVPPHACIAAHHPKHTDMQFTSRKHACRHYKHGNGEDDDDDRKNVNNDNAGHVVVDHGGGGDNDGDHGGRRFSEKNPPVADPHITSARSSITAPFPSYITPTFQTG